MDEEYWKGQVDAKLDFIKEQIRSSDANLLRNTIKNDSDHETIKNEITSLKVKSSMWGMLAGAIAAVGTMAAKYVWFK